jgi:hypothetical protein
MSEEAEIELPGGNVCGAAACGHGLASLPDGA